MRMLLTSLVALFASLVSGLVFGAGSESVEDILGAPPGARRVWTEETATDAGEAEDRIWLYRYEVSGMDCQDSALFVARRLKNAGIVPQSLRAEACSVPTNEPEVDISLTDCAKYCADLDRRHLPSSLQADYPGGLVSVVVGKRDPGVCIVDVWYLARPQGLSCMDRFGTGQDGPGGWKAVEGTLGRF